MSCPHKYISMQILDMNANANNLMTLNRNQHTGADHTLTKFTMKGIISNFFIQRQTDLN